ncbi:MULTISPECIES: hypothetical protein [unclassified Nonomuraea]|nr:MULTISPECIES: hypothetical protein [unclassified Nonomuraea]
MLQQQAAPDHTGMAEADPAVISPRVAAWRGNSSMARCRGG